MLGITICHGCTTGKFHATLFIDSQAFHPDFITNLDDVFGLLDSEVGQLTDVNQSILAWQEFNKSTEFLDGDDATAIDLANLRFGRHAFDGFAGNLHSFFRDGIDVDSSVVFDVDFATRFLDEAFDILATRSDQCTNLLGVDLEGDDARGVLAQFLARFGKSLGHLTQHKQTGHTGALDSFSHQFVGNAAKLQIQLKTSDTFFGTGQFAIHVAESIFPADDVGEERITGDLVQIIVVGANADTDSRHRANHGHAGVHQCE